jgi:hypothetical protein
MDFVLGNLNDSESLRRAIQGCEYMIHIANPIPST